MVIVNLWESEEGSEQAAQDPELQEAREAMRDRSSDGTA